MVAVRPCGLSALDFRFRCLALVSSRARCCRSSAPEKSSGISTISKKYCVPELEVDAAMSRKTVGPGKEDAKSKLKRLGFTVGRLVLFTEPETSSSPAKSASQEEPDLWTTVDLKHLDPVPLFLRTAVYSLTHEERTQVRDFSSKSFEKGAWRSRLFALVDGAMVVEEVASNVAKVSKVYNRIAKKLGPAAAYAKTAKMFSSRMVNGFGYEARTERDETHHPRTGMPEGRRPLREIESTEFSSMSEFEPDPRTPSSGPGGASRTIKPGKRRAGENKSPVAKRSLMFQPERLPAGGAAALSPEQQQTPSSSRHSAASPFLVSNEEAAELKRNTGAAAARGADVSIYFSLFLFSSFFSNFSRNFIWAEQKRVAEFALRQDNIRVAP